MAAVQLRAANATLAILAILVFLATGVATIADETARPTTAEIQSGINKLFLAAQYDSILHLIPGYIARAEADRDSVLLVLAITQRGRALMSKGRNQEAERDIDLGIRMAESVRDTFGLMSAVHLKGSVFRSRGDVDGAMHCFERRLELARRVRSPVDEGWALAGIAFMRHQRGDHEGARSDYLRAIELARPAHESSLEITALNGLGRVHSAIGDPNLSARSFERALVLSREVGDRVNEMWATNNLGALEVQRDDLSRAAQFQQRAFELAREVYPQGMVIPAIGLASRARDLGEYARADAILQEAREYCRAHSQDVYLSTVDFYIAHLRETEGRPREAAMIFRRLLLQPGRLESQTRDWAVVRLARILAESDSLSQAEALVVDRLDAPDLNEAVRQSMHELLSAVYLKRNRGTKALEQATRARESAEQFGARRFAAMMQLRESICLRNLGRDDEAKRVLGAAIDSIEAIRGGISTAEWREVYGQEIARDVLDAGRVLMEYPPSLPLSTRERAFFDAMQRFRTRTLLDRISDTPRGPHEAAERWSSRPATTDDVQAVLAPDELLLEFFVGSAESYLVAITRDDVRVVKLPGPESPLAESIDLYHRALASADLGLHADFPPERLTPVQQSIGMAVMGEVDDLVENARCVLIAPDGFFAVIPFGTLILAPNSSRLLMETKDVVQIPSASVLALQRSRPNELHAGAARIVALEAGRESGLPGAHDEVRDLSNRYAGVKRVRGLSGGGEGFAVIAGQCDVLHVATHAFIVDQSPWQSGLLLAGDIEAVDPAATTAVPTARSAEATAILSTADSTLVAQEFRSDPFVRAWQIAKLSLPMTLTVLAGCETAGGRVTTGEGVIGLTSAFMSAGVPVVVSSLWPVDDRATAHVMKRFYEYLSKGESVATSLRLAQLDARDTGGRSHPFYWAGFTVVGDGSIVVRVEERSSRLQVALLAVLALGLAGVTIALLRRRRPRFTPSE